MRILLILPGGLYETHTEQAQPVFRQLLVQLSKLHDVAAAVPSQGEAPAGDNPLPCRVIQLPPLPGLHTGIFPTGRSRLPELLAALGSWRPEIVHALGPEITGRLAKRVSRRFRIPLVCSVTGSRSTLANLDGMRASAQRRLERRFNRILRFASAVTAGSHYALQQLPWFGRWIPLGVDMERFRSTISRPHGPPWRFLHVGELSTVKNQGLLIDIMRVMRSRNFRFHLDWIGCEAEGTRLLRKLAQIGLEEHITLHGIVPNSRLPRFYRQAHLFIQTSTYESQGIAQLEAAAAGVPTLGTPVGLVHDLAPQAAAAVYSNKPEDFADAIESVLKDSEHRARLARSAQDFAASHDASWSAGAFSELYQETAKPSPPQVVSKATYEDYLLACGGQWISKGGARASLAMLGRAGIEEEHAVLDIGCGSGRTLARLAALGTEEVTGIDTNPRALQHAHRLLSRLGLRSRARLLLVKPGPLPFSAGSFDRIVTEHVLAHQAPETLRTMLQECRRCLVPHGRLVLSELVWKAGLTASARTEINKEAGSILGHPLVSDNPVTAEDWKNLALENGFKLLSSTDVQGLILQSPRDDVYVPELEQELVLHARRLCLESFFKARCGKTRKRFRKAEQVLARHRENTEHRLFVFEKTLT